MGFWRKEIASINLTQNFLIFGLKPTTYSVTFYNSIFGPSIRVNAEPWVLKHDIFFGTEFFVITIMPWQKGQLSEKDLIKHLNLMRKYAGLPEEVIGSNVIDLATHPLNQ